jgi:hypothetical protein
VNRALLAGSAVAVVAAAGIAIGGATMLTDNSTTALVVAPTTQNCGDWGVTMTQGECQAAGVIRYVALYNLQGSAQFCKWRGANPGEWSRLNSYAASATLPQNIVTWFGASIRNEIEAYFATGAPTMSYQTPGGTVAGIQPNTSQNACTGKVLAAPSIQGVTPGQTDATVTIGG